MQKIFTGVGTGRASPQDSDSDRWQALSEGRKGNTGVSGWTTDFENYIPGREIGSWQKKTETGNL